MDTRLNLPIARWQGGVVSGNEYFLKHFGKNFSKADKVIDVGEIIFVRKDGRTYFSRRGELMVFQDITEIYDEFEKLKKLGDLLFIAFSLSSQIFMADDRKKMVELFCIHTSRFESCTAVYVSDATGNQYRCREDVFHCSYLNYIPRILGLINASTCGCNKPIEHRYLLTIPYLKDSAVYIFLKDISEEEMQILKDMVEVLSYSIELKTAQREKEKTFEQLKENLKYFELIADKLRNPLAVIKGYLELRGEIEAEKVFDKISEQADRMHAILDELRIAELKTTELVRK